MNPTPNYLLFCGTAYYPEGGTNDLFGFYIERGKAVDDGRYHCSQSSSHWWHIYALDQRRIVAYGKNSYLSPNYIENLEA
ncbi:MAG: hypothetical protein EPN91_11985 [Salinibacterium sp.]|nr:MAG: hypothetical protein EPN91_11985 [Salinibacterium sp.]